MRLPVREVLLGAAIAAFAGYGTASAQSVGVEVYSGAPYSYTDDDYYFYQSTPRVYGYTSDVVEPDVIVRARPASCGEFRYWNGERCADARVNPPDVR